MPLILPTTFVPTLNPTGATKMTMTTEMTNPELLNYLIESATVPAEAKTAYYAGYFEGTLLTLMERFPEVRAEIEDRVNYRRSN